MLPSTGYFKNINCPLFEKDKCDRIYCHFKHKKPDTIINYIPTPVQQSKKQNESILEYKPIPFIKLKKADDKEEFKKNIEKDNNEKINKESSVDSVKEKQVDLDLYKSIESKLISIFQDSKSDNDMKDKCENIKKDDCNYTEELDKITKETKTTKDQQDKEIIESKQQSKQKAIHLIDESEQKEDESLNPVSKKARIAHKAGDAVNPSINVLLPAKKIRMSPGEVMVNRFSQVAKDDKLPTTKNTNAKTRVAHRPTINKIDNSGAKRPVLPLELGSKIPNIIRQRYLNSIIDEFLKVCKDAEEAYQKALNEELLIYKRSPSKQSYINLVANAIKRIRDSIKSKVT